MTGRRSRGKKGPHEEAVILSATNGEEQILDKSQGFPGGRASHRDCKAVKYMAHSHLSRSGTPSPQADDEVKGGNPSVSFPTAAINLSCLLYPKKSFLKKRSYPSRITAFFRVGRLQPIKKKSFD